jgi:hypothetical protein
MKRLGGAAAGWLALTIWGSAAAQDRPPPSLVEVQCGQEVDRRHPPGSLSRSRNERQRLIEACVANGGRLP